MIKEQQGRPKLCLPFFKIDTVADMPMHEKTPSWIKFLGIQQNSPSTEQWISSIGGFLCILMVFSVSYRAMDLQGASAILPSMGAATVLLFAVPKGPLSQPWALFAGNFLSEIIGVACYQWIENTFIAAAAAVGLSTLAMLASRCIHPPGGATALAAVIGGDAIHQLGFSYALVPTLLNCLIVFIAAMLFNNLFGWRRYPALKIITPSKHTTNNASNITALHLQQTLKSLDHLSQAPLTATNLKKLLDHSLELANKKRNPELTLEVGACYSNGNPDFEWSIRQITDILSHPKPEHYMVVYQIVEGKQKRRSDSCQLLEFCDWAKLRVDYVQR